MEEKSNSSKWLIGCGIGCGVIILIGIIFIISAYFLCKSTVQNFQQVEMTQEELTERYGAIVDFTPSPTASIAAERIELFLSVRDSMAAAIRKLDTTLTKLESLDSEQNEERSFWGVVGGIRNGFGMIPNIAEFYLSRNNALLSLDMSPGEYYYMYVIAFYSYLGKSPNDGPGDQLIHSGRGFTFSTSDSEENDDEFWRKEIREETGMQVIQRIRWKIIPILENQLNAIKMNSSNFSWSWRTALESEIDKLKDDRERIPWEDNLPVQLKNSLRPYRQQLEESYNPKTNIFELMQEQDWND